MYRSAEVEHKYLVNVLRGVVGMLGPSGVAHRSENAADQSRSAAWTVPEEAGE